MSERASKADANARRYRWPDRPLAVVGVDGPEPADIEQAVAAGATPYAAAMLERGADLRADCVAPRFNNLKTYSLPWP